jgi:hypothetical protein
MTALPKLAISRMTVEEFLDWPGDAGGQKFELVDGEPRAMAPASISRGSVLYRGRAGGHPKGQVGRKHADPGSRSDLRAFR